MTALSIPELAGYAKAAGFTGDNLVTIVAIALRESGGNASVIGDIDNPHAGCRSYGLVQINVCPQGTAGGNNRGTPWRENPTTLLDPVTNFKAAYEMSGGGRNFGPWTTYRAGIPAPDVARVRAAIGDPNSVTASSASSSSSSSDPAAGSSSPTIFARLLDWTTWRSVLYVVGGLGLVAAGLIILNRDKIAGALSAAGVTGPAKMAPDDGSDDTAAGDELADTSTAATMIQGA